MELFPTVFIDRDGTINIDGGYINTPDHFDIYPFAAQAVRMLNVHGWQCVVVTNQSGIGRGFYTTEIMHSINSKMYRHFEKQGAKIDGLYYCPHDPNSKIEEFRVKCECRKPKTGMLEAAAADLPIDRNRTIFIGDKYSDMQTGFNFGSKTIMVKTGYGKGEIEQFSASWSRQPDYCAENLLEAVNIILKHNL